MRSNRKQKLLIVAFILLGSAATVGLMLYAFNQGLNVYFTPTEVAEGKAGTSKNFRIGGMVKEGSLQRQGEGTKIKFITTDNYKEFAVVYEGVLPDLFREGQGVVAEGYLDDEGVFHARQILANHDEDYMPPEVKNALDAAEKLKAEAAGAAVQ